MKTLQRWLEAFERWYTGSVAIQRRGVEEDARRLGGRVVWNDAATGD